MTKNKRELIFYYKARPDPHAKPTFEGEEPAASGNIDLEIILLGPKREDLKIRNKKRKSSSKLRELFSFGKSRTQANDDDDDGYEDYKEDEEDEKTEDSRSLAPKDNKAPVDDEPASDEDDDEDEDDDDNYQSADDSKPGDDRMKDDVVKKDNKNVSRIPRIKSSSSATGRKSSKSPHRNKNLLSRLESMFSTSDTLAPGNSGSNVDYMDYF